MNKKTCQGGLSIPKQVILPLLSSCNLNCIFCSHKQNIPGINTEYLRPRTVQEVKKSLQQLGRPAKIVIGESASRIIEGEPFLHPEILDILRLIRFTFPDSSISITTNGSLLTEKLLKELAELEQVELTVSLNSASIEGRRLLMGDHSGYIAIRAVELLQGLGIRFHGSVVALPHLVGWDDLAHTLRFLDDTGASTIRLFLPGISRHSPLWSPDIWTLYHEVRDFGLSIRSELKAPVLIEPPQVDSLHAVIEGVMFNSAAWKAGLRAGDLIRAVGGKEVFSRVDAFRRVSEARNPVISVQRGQTLFEVSLKKPPGVPAGFAMDFDLDPHDFWRAERIVRRYGGEPALVLTSQLAAPVVTIALQQHGLGDVVRVEPVPSRFFGGTIQAAGLLMVSDFIAAFDAQRIRAVIAPPGLKSKGFKLLLLPGIPFDDRGRDLLDVSYLQLEEQFGLKVELV